MKYGTMSCLSSDEMVLMIMKNERENDPNSGLFALPGGNLKDWEKGSRSPLGRLESAVRETQEETGLTLIDPVFRGVVLFDNFERIFDNWPDKKKDNFLVYMFDATKYTGKLKSETEEGMPLWVYRGFIDRIPKNAGDKKMYEWLNDGRNFVGVIKHKGMVLDEQGTFVDYFG